MRTQATIRILNRLIITCRNEEEMCGACSDATESAGLGSLLRYRGEEWGRQGDELQALFLLLGGTPAISCDTSADFEAEWCHCASLGCLASATWHQSRFQAF